MILCLGLGGEGGEGEGGGRGGGGEEEGERRRGERGGKVWPLPHLDTAGGSKKVTGCVLDSRIVVCCGVVWYAVVWYGMVCCGRVWYGM